MELRTLLSTAVGRLSVRAADRCLDRRQRVSRPRTPPRSCRERARVAAHQCHRPRAPAAQINRRCPSSHCERGSVFRVVRRLGFGNKTLPNRISICASRRTRRYMIVLGFDDPRNSDLSTQRHNGRWPMAPWRQLFFGSESEPGSAANSDHIAQSPTDEAGRSAVVRAKCRRRRGASSRSSS